MKEQILAIKKLNAAYIASLEWDRCPSEEEAHEVAEVFETGISLDELKDALVNNQGRRPDEISGQMSALIALLQP